jgi:iron(III) transport system substrate-binding protein
MRAGKVLVAVLMLSAAACGGSGGETENAAAPATPAAQKQAGGEVNLYSARHYDTDLPLYERFTAETGIKINRIEGKADELVARMKSEGANSPADLFITADAGALWRAQQAGLFQPVQSEALNAAVPANLREPGGNWYGVSKRARVVAYDPAKVKAEEVDTYEELASPRFRGKLCVRSSDNIYNLSLTGALIQAWGEPKTEEWARGIVANLARQPEGGDRDQIKAVGAGLCEIAITNSYYFIRMATGEDQADRAVAGKLRLAFPSLNGQGSHVNISGAGIAANAPNKANAVRLLEFFASPAAQEHFARFNNEYPVSPSVKAPAPVDAYANFSANPMPVAEFAAQQPKAQALMTRAGWR